MQESTFDITTPEGAIETFAAWPDAPRSHPAVLLYMDAPGIREELRDFCRRIAGQGYCAVLPDMYYRRGRIRFDLATLRDEGRGQMFECVRSLNNELVMGDTRAILAHLQTMDPVAAGPKGCIGYCMSGQYVFSAAGTFPDDFSAAASLYGVGIVSKKPDSPHLLAGRIKGELYLGFAETDEYVNDDVVPTLKAALDQHDVSYRLDTWPSTHHGFCFPERGAAYHEEAAEQVWELVFDMFKRRLR